MWDRLKAWWPGWRMLLYAALNILYPYTGSIASGRVRAVYALPLILLSSPFGYQRHDVVLDRVYVANLTFIGYGLYVVLLTHALWTLRWPQKFRHAWFAVLAMFAVAFASSYYSLLGSNATSLEVVRLEPFPPTAVIVSGGETFAVGDYVTGRGELGYSWFGILGALPGKVTVRTAPDGVKHICNEEGDCRSADDLCVTIDEASAEIDLDEDEYLLFTRRGERRIHDRVFRLSDVTRVTRVFFGDRFIDFGRPPPGPCVLD